MSARNVFSKTKPKRNATTAFPSGLLTGDPSWWHCQVRPSPPMPVWGNECHQSLMLKKLGIGSVFNNSLTQRKLPFLCLQTRALILFSPRWALQGSGDLDQHRAHSDWVNEGRSRHRTTGWVRPTPALKSSQQTRDHPACLRQCSHAIILFCSEPQDDGYNNSKKEIGFQS